MSDLFDPLIKFKIPYEKFVRKENILKLNEKVSYSYSLDDYPLKITLINKVIGKVDQKILTVDKLVIDPKTFELADEYQLMNEFYSDYKKHLSILVACLYEFKLISIQSVFNSVSSEGNLDTGSYNFSLAMNGLMNEKTLISVNMGLGNNQIIVTGRNFKYILAKDDLLSASFKADFKKSFDSFITDFYKNEINSLYNYLEGSMSKADIISNLRFYMEMFSMIKI